MTRGSIIGTIIASFFGGYWMGERRPIGYILTIGALIYIISTIGCGSIELQPQDSGPSTVKVGVDVLVQDAPDSAKQIDAIDAGNTASVDGPLYDASIVADKDGEATADVPGARLSPQTNDGSDDGGHSETQPDSDAGVTSPPQDCQPRTCYPVTDPTHSTCPCRY